MDELDFEEKPLARAPGNYRIPLIEHDVDSVPVQDIRFDKDGTRWHVGSAPKLKSTISSMMAMGAFGASSKPRASIGTIKRAEDINRQIAHNYVHSGKIKFQFARRKGSSIVAACTPMDPGMAPRIGTPSNAGQLMMAGNSFSSTWQQRNALAQMRSGGMIPSFSAPASLSSTMGATQKVKRKKLLPYAIQTQKDWDNYLENQVRDLPASLKF
jgi:hypothetical protein